MKITIKTKSVFRIVQEIFCTLTKPRPLQGISIHLNNFKP